MSLIAERDMLVLLTLPLPSALIVCHVQRVEAKAVLAEETLVVSDPPQQLPLRESAPAVGLLGNTHTLHASPHAVCTGEDAVALDLALGAADAG